MSISIVYDLVNKLFDPFYGSRMVDIILNYIHSCLKKSFCFKLVSSLFTLKGNLYWFENNKKIMLN